MIGRWTPTALAVLALVAASCAESPVEPNDVAPASAVADDGRAALGGPFGRFRDALGLTDAQAGQIRAIQEELRAANAPLLEQLRPARGERRRALDESQRALFEQLRANNRSAQEKIHAVLTAEQRAKLAELRPERPQGEGRGMRPGGPGVGGLGLLVRIVGQLDLTEDQRARIRTIAQELAEQNRPLLEQLRASGARPFPRDGGAADNPLIQQIRANTTAAMERIEGVLTAEQRARLEELRARRPEGRPARPDRPGRGPRGG